MSNSLENLMPEADLTHEEKWDDSLILSIFYDSINSYGSNTAAHHNESISRKRRRNYDTATAASKDQSSSAGIRNLSKADMLHQSRIGAWEAVDTHGSTSSSKPSTQDREPGEVVDDEWNDASAKGEHSRILNAEIDDGLTQAPSSSSSSSSTKHINEELNISLNEMLSLWYQAGYATGRYYTLLELSSNQSNPDGAS
jgi:hypothetical protein